MGRQALCLLGKIYVQGYDKKGDSVFTTLINQCKEATDKVTEARALAYRGIYTPVTSTSILIKIADLQKAADLYHQLKNTEAEINVRTDIGYFSIIIGQLEQSREAFSDALNLAESIQYPYIHYNTDALTMITIFEGKFGEPLKYALQTIKIAEQNRDSLGWAYFYSRLSTLYLSEGRVQESLNMSKKSIERFVIDHDPAVYNVLKNILSKMGFEDHGKEALKLTKDISKKVRAPGTYTEQYFYHSAFAQCYTSVGMLDSAESHLLIMDSLETKAEKFSGSLRRIEINDHYAFIAIKRGQYFKAMENFEKHFAEFSPLQRSLPTDLHIYRQMIMIDSTLEDYKSGISHYKKYTQLLDSSFRVTKIRQAEELQVLYQTEEKENQITFLNQRATIEQANLSQVTLIRNVTIAGIIGVLFIAGLLFRQSRLRKKSNTVITQKNGVLQHYLTEKEWLLKEIHHRVKNNLQIVMSLLNSQKAYIENDAALNAIHDSQHRVHAMSLIHQKLYTTENVSSIDMSSYIRELVSYLSDSFNSGRRIRFEHDIEPLDLDVSQAVPIGLILNEAITNSIKYAFPDGRDGIISISLISVSPNHYLLSIAENGVGMPSHFNNKKPGSLGMTLMAGLSEDLDGKFTIENNNGTVIKISIVHDLTIKRPSIASASFLSSN